MVSRTLLGPSSGGVEVSPDEVLVSTQIATIALGARFQSIVPVTAGTTLGMKIANVPVVFLGNAILTRLRLQTVRIVAALLFVAIGAWLLFATVATMKV